MSKFRSGEAYDALGTTLKSREKMGIGSAPGWGAFVGAAWAAVAVALVGFLGFAPPDRLVLFGFLAVGVAGGAVALTPRQHMRTARFGAAAAVAGFLGAFAVTGIPEYLSGGQGSGQCELRVDTTEPLTSPTRIATSARQPLDLSTVDSLRWVSTAPAGVADWRRDLGFRIGGFDVVVVRDTADTATVDLNDGGVMDVEEILASVESTLGAAPTGAYHVVVALEAPEADCTLSAYVKIAPTHLWDGPILATLWIVALAIPVATAAIAYRMRRAG